MLMATVKMAHFLIISQETNSAISGKRVSAYYDIESENMEKVHLLSY